LLDAVDAGEFEVLTLLWQHGELEDHLKARGHHVEVVPMPDTVRSMTRADAVTPSSLRTVLGLGPFLVTLLGRLRQLDPDVIHTNSLKSDVVGTALLPFLRASLVWHLHDRLAADYLPAPPRVMLRALARVAPRAVVANSQATAATLPSSVMPVVAYPGLSPKQLLAPPQWSPRSGAPTVGMLARLSPTKGQLQLVRAAAIVHEQRPDVRFVVAGAPTFGQGDYAEAVRTEVENLGLAGAVSLRGFVDDPRPWLDTLDVLVHPATVPEPYGQAVSEAMARGVPVVATDAGGTSELLRDPTTGSLCGWPLALEPSESLAERLAETILTVLSDPEEAWARSLTAWQAVSTEHTILRTAAVVQDVWRSVEAGRGRG
jgi:glycosyltransferase involved in cell wall biosynthesis